MPKNNKVIIFDTTLRDGELTPGIKMNIQQKISLAKLLENLGVDVIEVSYPGQSQKDFEELFQLSKLIQKSILCGLASSKANEVIRVAEALKLAKRGRIHTYTSVNVPKQRESQVLELIKNSVTLSRNHCDDVEWSAFDATRSRPDFLCISIEVAIQSGATTVNVPDSLGLALPEDFVQLIKMIFNQVPNIEKAVVSVHCHNDLNRAVENSLTALTCGVRQIECAINGLGARKGNADLEKIVREVSKNQNYLIEVDTSLLAQASELVTQITPKS